MSYIRIDTDDIISDIDTIDLLEELYNRDLDDSEIETLKKLLNGEEEVFFPKTLKDKMKYNLFLEHFDNITLEDLEKLVQL